MNGLKELYIGPLDFMPYVKALKQYQSGRNEIFLFNVPYELEKCLFLLVHHQERTFLYSNLWRFNILGLYPMTDFVTLELQGSFGRNIWLSKMLPERWAFLLERYS